MSPIFNLFIISINFLKVVKNKYYEKYIDDQTDLFKVLANSCVAIDSYRSSFRYCAAEVPGLSAAAAQHSLISSASLFIPHEFLRIVAG